MKTETISIDGMTCESCERLITKAVEAAGGKVDKISSSEGFAVVEYPEHERKKIINAIEAAGYAPDSLPGKGNKESFEAELAHFARNFFSGHHEAAAVRDSAKYSLLTFVILGAISLAIASFMQVKPELAVFIYYAAITAASVSGAVFVYRAYKEYTCMEGMMIGMTIGMMAGFMLGAIIGATNGMFMGSVFGMVVGMAIGAYCGKCCGIMGLMEGMMAGLMGGTMGAMLSVMMQYDHLQFFMPIFMAACLLILAGLGYMVHKYAGRRQTAAKVEFAPIFLTAALLFGLTIEILLMAPKFGVVV
jgi:copper chaperone CopZ